MVETVSRPRAAVSWSSADFQPCGLRQCLCVEKEKPLPEGPSSGRRAGVPQPWSWSLCLSAVSFAVSESSESRQRVVMENPSAHFCEVPRQGKGVSGEGGKCYIFSCNW